MTPCAPSLLGQANGVSQINTGLIQVDTVTQQNTASAEESAAAAEELNSQALSLNNLLHQFKLNSTASSVLDQQEYYNTNPQSITSDPTSEYTDSKVITSSTQIQLYDSDFDYYNPLAT